MIEKEETVNWGLLELEVFVRKIYTKLGFSNESANTIAKLITLSEARAITSHGINMLPGYLTQILDGGVNINPQISHLNERENSLVMDGDNGPGHLVAQKAMETAVKKAKKNTVGIVSVKNSNHFGAASSYLDIAADNNMIAIITTTTTPLISAPKGASRMIGNNPIAAVIPKLDNNHVIFDISMSEISASKVKQYQDALLDLPNDYILDNNGVPNNKPASYFNGGSLRPIGNHKGFVMALLFDVLCGGLSNGGFSKDAKSWRKHPSEPSNISHFVLAINIESFIELNVFEDRVSDLVGFLENIEPFASTDAQCIPGKNLKIRYEQSLKNGVRIPINTLEKINKVLTAKGAQWKVTLDGGITNEVYDNNK